MPVSPVHHSHPAAEPKQGFGSYFGKGHVNAYFLILLRQAAEFFKNLRQLLTPEKVFFVAVAVAVVALFGRNLKDIFLVAVLGIAASYSTIYKRTIRVPSAVELVTFGTVITGAAYGPFVGVLFGVITTIASEIISSGIDVNTMFYAISRGISGGIARFLIIDLGIGVVMAGVIALAIFHVISDALYLMSGGIEAVPKLVYFVIVNTLFNLLVFSFFGSLVLGFAGL